MLLFLNNKITRLTPPVPAHFMPETHPVRSSKREITMEWAVYALQKFGKTPYGRVFILPIVGLFIAFGNVLGYDIPVNKALAVCCFPLR